jgi:hypothetical protein
MSSEFSLKNHHIGGGGIFDRGRHAFVIPHRPQTYIEVKDLAQSHVQRPDATAYRGCEGALDGYQMFMNGIQGLLRQPFTRQVISLFTCIHFFPNDLPLAPVRFFHCSVKHPYRGSPNIRACSVSLYERYNWKIGNCNFSHLVGNLFSGHLLLFS